MKNIVFILFVGCFFLTGCRDKNTSETIDSQSIEQMQEQTLNLEKATKENLEIKNDIDKTVDELDALMQEMDE